MPLSAVEGEVLAFARAVAECRVDPIVPGAAAATDALLRQHRLAPLAFAAGARRFLDDYATWAVRAEHLEMLAREIATVFNDASLPVALVKGMSYVSTIYSAPAERPMLDVDVLVHPARFARAVSCLAEVGFRTFRYSRWRHAVPMFRGDEVIDLHRSAREPAAERIDHDAMWKRAQAIPGWSGVYRLDPTDEMVFHCCDMVRNGFFVPLISFVDASRLLDRTDRGATIERASSQRLRRPVKATFAALDRFLTGSGQGLRALGDPPGRMLRFVDQLRWVDDLGQLAGLAAARAFELAGRRWTGTRAAVRRR